MDCISSEIYVASSFSYLFRAWFKHCNKAGGIFTLVLTVFDWNSLLHNFVVGFFPFISGILVRTEKTEKHWGWL